MKRYISALTTLITLLAAITLLVSAFLPTRNAQAESPTRGGGGISPISPGGIIVNTTPTYKWSMVTGATRYQYQVYQGSTLFFTKYTTSATCTGYTCQQKPTNTLTFSNFKWRVRAYTVGGWLPWSVYKYFTVTHPPSSFDSQFNGSKTGWAKMAGANWGVSSSAMYTNGSEDQVTSAYRTSSAAYADFIYEARVKRTGGEYGVYYPPNYLAVRVGSNIVSTYLDWCPGYFFGYMNNGLYSVWKLYSDGSETPIQMWTHSDAIIPYAWNTLKVEASGDVFMFYINDTLVKTFSDSSRAKGYVGLTMFKSGTTATQFKVDWAKLSIPASPAAVPSNAQVSPEQEALNQAAMQAGETRSFEGYFLK